MLPARYFMFVGALFLLLLFTVVKSSRYDFLVFEDFEITKMVSTQFNDSWTQSIALKMYTRRKTSIEKPGCNRT